jgi:hypothetical protein
MEPQTDLSSIQMRQSNYLQIPTFTYMQRHNPLFVSTIRTTLCDVMCTTNTTLPHSEMKAPPPSELPLLVTLPYEKASHAIPLDKKLTTKFQTFRFEESIIRKAMELKKERDSFLYNLRNDKAEKER